MLKLISPKKCQLVDLSQNLQDKDSKKPLSSENDLINDELKVVRDALAISKIPLEAALFEGKIPVARKDQVYDNKIMEDVNWQDIPEVSDFTILGNKNGVNEWFMVATLSGVRTNKRFQGTQYVFHRDPHGTFSCTFYWADKQELQGINVFPCKKKAGLLVQPEFVSSEKLARD